MSNKIEINPHVNVSIYLFIYLFIFWISNGREKFSLSSNEIGTIHSPQSIYFNKFNQLLNIIKRNKEVVFCLMQINRHIYLYI